MRCSTNRTPFYRCHRRHCCRVKCGAIVRARHQYGWRRSQLYRVRLWRVVVEKGLDLLAMDLDHQLAVMNPVPFFTAVHAPPETISHNPVSESSRKAAPADVVAVWDGPGSRYLNVGIMWMRSTPATLELARRSENRSWVGWEQQIFNEELNFNKELSGVRCCHTICLKKFLSHASNASAKLPKKSGSGTGQREQVGEPIDATMTRLGRRRTRHTDRRRRGRTVGRQTGTCCARSTPRTGNMADATTSIMSA